MSEQPVKTSDELSEHDKEQDASAQEEDERPEDEQREGTQGTDGTQNTEDDTVSEELEDLPGAAFQK
jgi:hypothetical protein